VLHGSDLNTYGSLLQNGSPGILFHLGSSIQEAVTRNLGVGVNDQDVVAESNVTCNKVSSIPFQLQAGKTAYHQPKYDLHLPQQHQQVLVRMHWPHH